MPTLKQRLDAVIARIEQLDKERLDIYRESLDVPDEEKVCGDLVSHMILEDAALVNEEPGKAPLSVRSMHWLDDEIPLREEGLAPVAIRLADSEETHFGILIGSLPLGLSTSFHKETGMLTLQLGHYNPAIIVPALGRVVFGCESWWETIKSEEDLKQITDEDIENIWYVKALREKWEGADHV